MSEKRLSGNRDVTPGLENVARRLRTQTHTLTHSHTTEGHVKGQTQEKDTKQTGHTDRQTKTEDDVNTQTDSVGSHTHTLQIY